MRHVIIGSGPAGVVAAETLRKADAAAQITVLCGEGEAPYARMAIPYLLSQQIEEAGTHLRQQKDHYRRLGIELVQGRAKSVDTAQCAVKLENGQALPYDRLLIASGARPSRQNIPGIDLPGVHSCWTLADVRAITAKAKPGTRIVQMGAGFVGCIIIEGLLQRGFDLTILVRSGRMVSRMMNPIASGMIRRWCEAKGVRILVNTQAEKIAAANGELQVTLSGNKLMPADIYLSLVGVTANTDFLEGSGVSLGKGVLVDADMQTNVPGIYAAGDVAEFTDRITGVRQVNAIQPNAVEQARIAAQNMAGQRASSHGSFAFNVLTTLGLSSSSFGAWEGLPGGESAELVDEQRYRYLRLEFKDDCLVGANAVGFTDHIGVLRGLIEGKVRLGAWKQRLLHDPTQLMPAYLACAQKAA